MSENNPLDLSALGNAIASGLYNPSNVFVDALRIFSDAKRGLSPTSTTVPMVDLLMYMGTQASITSDQINRLGRRLLAEYATTRDELVHHFDYEELQTIYANPSHLTAKLVIPLTVLSR